MTRGEHRATRWGVALLAAGLLLVELLSFRLSAAILGRDFALFAGLLLPAAGALGVTVVVPAARLGWGALGSLLGHEPPRPSPALASARAAHLAALAGAAAVAGAIGLTWVSQHVARAGGEATSFQVGVALAACWLPALLGAASMGQALTRGVSVVGRLLFAEAVGAAGICMLLPALMDLGAPRSAVLSGLLFAGSAFAFARAGRPARPQLSALATLPLAVFALLAGDVGAPWLKVRTDTGRRTRIGDQIWTAEGLIAVEKVQRGKTRLAVDDGEPIALAYALKDKQKPAFEPQDLLFVASPPDDLGPVLVVASAGAREVAAALSYDHPRVDVVELHGKLISEVLLDRYAEASGGVLDDPTRVGLRVSDGRADLDALGRDYQFVLVMGQPRLLQAAPRLLGQQDRLYTVAAVRGFLERLRQDGSLLLSLPRRALPAVMAAVVEASGTPAEEARRRMMACSDGATAVLLVDAKPMAPARLHKLDKRCKKSSLNVEYPMSSPKGRKSRKAIADEAEGQARRLAWIEAGVPIRDDKPFLDPAGTRPIGAVLASLRPTAPPPPSASKPATAPKAQPSNLPKSPAARAKRGKQAVEATPSASAEPAASEVEVEAEEAEAELPTAASVAFVAVLMASLSLLLGLLVPSSRRRQPASGRAPLALRLSFPFVGAGLALCLFALGEVVLRILGAASYGWALVIPLGLVGLGTGRLWVDVVSPDVLSRRLPFLLIAVTGWLLAVLFLAPTLSAQVTAPLTARWLVAGLSLLLSGAALGLPLAAGLALVGRVDPNPVAWCWAAHLGGWAFGGALAAWLVTELGLAKLWPLGLALFVVGAALLVSGGRRIRSGAAVPAAAPGAGTSSAGLAAPAAQ